MTPPAKSATRCAWPGIVKEFEGQDANDDILQARTWERHGRRNDPRASTVTSRRRCARSQCPCYSMAIGDGPLFPDHRRQVRTTAFYPMPGGLRADSLALGPSGGRSPGFGRCGLSEFAHPRVPRGAARTVAHCGDFDEPGVPFWRCDFCAANADEGGMSEADRGSPSSHGQRRQLDPRLDVEGGELVWVDDVRFRLRSQRQSRRSDAPMEPQESPLLPRAPRPARATVPFGSTRRNRCGIACLAVTRRSRRRYSHRSSPPRPRRRSSSARCWVNAPYRHRHRTP